MIQARTRYKKHFNTVVQEGMVHRGTRRHAGGTLGANMRDNVDLGRELTSCQA